MVLDRLLGTQPESSEPAEPRVDPLLNDHEAYEWARRLETGSWREFRDFLVAGDDFERRDFLMREIAGVFSGGRPPWMDEWAQREPSGPFGLLFRGQHGIAWAWKVRTGARAANVSEDQFKTFQQILDYARADLLRAAELAPGDAGPWVAMLDVARGLEYEKPGLLELFGKVQERHPWYARACFSIVQGLAPKWAGSRELMFDFARQLSEASPPGTGVHVALAHAHVEAFFDEKADAYWRDDRVRSDIAHAAAQSVDTRLASDTDWESRRRIPWHNVFAFCYWCMDDAPAFLREYRTMKNVITYPWATATDPPARLAAAHRGMTAIMPLVAGSPGPRNEFEAP